MSHTQTYRALAAERISYTPMYGYRVEGDEPSPHLNEPAQSICTGDPE